MEKDYTQQDLQAFEKSDCYKKIIKKCVNKRETIEKKIWDAFISGTDERALEYNMHHNFLEIYKVYDSIISDIDDESVGAKAFSLCLEEDIENKKEGIIKQINNGFGAPYSQMELTKTDLDRSQVIAYKLVEGLLPAMIEKFNQPDETEVEGAF